MRELSLLVILINVIFSNRLFLLNKYKHKKFILNHKLKFTKWIPSKDKNGDP